MTQQQTFPMSPAASTVVLPPPVFAPQQTSFGMQTIAAPSPAARATQSRALVARQSAPEGAFTLPEQQQLALNEGDAAIVRFIASHPQCQNSQRDIARFLQLILGAKLRGVDVTSILRTYGLMVNDKKVNPTKFRVGRTKGDPNLAFDSAVAGSRGKAQSTPLPSLLWSIADKNCTNLAQLNAQIEAVLQGNFGVNTANIPLPALSKEAPASAQVNQALALFFEAHPECSANRASINELLNLIDSHHLTGRELYALFRVFYIEHLIGSQKRGGRVPTLSDTRYSKGAIALNIETKPRKTTSKSVMKRSLLWALLERYCGQIDGIINQMNSILRNHVAARQRGEKRTELSVRAASPQFEEYTEEIVFSPSSSSSPAYRGTPQQQQPQFSPTNPFAPGVSDAMDVDQGYQHPPTPMRRVRSTTSRRN